VSNLDRFTAVVTAVWYLVFVPWFVITFTDSAWAWFVLGVIVVLALVDLYVLCVHRVWPWQWYRLREEHND
jgi:hypothetical protein